MKLYTGLQDQSCLSKVYIGLHTIVYTCLRSPLDVYSINDYFLRYGLVDYIYFYLSTVHIT